MRRKPFFPIGLYYGFEEMDDPSGRGLAKLKNMGFNTLFILDRDRPVYDRIAAHGLHVWCRPPGALHDSHETLRKFIIEYRNHPAILFWEHDDEPVLNGGQIERSRIGYQLVKQLDPNHPVLCTQAPNPSQVEAFHIPRESLNQTAPRLLCGRVGSRISRDRTPIVLAINRWTPRSQAVNPAGSTQ